MNHIEEKLNQPAKEIVEKETGGVSFPIESVDVKRILPNDEFRKEFKKFFKDLYPKDIIEKMRQENYNPIIIGYEHEKNLINLPSIKKAYQQIREANPTKKIKVAYEILPPIQLIWIKEFLRDEKEYNATGKIEGEIPIPGKIKDLKAYRSKLNKVHSENLALWLLDNGFDVIPIEHEDAIRWQKEYISTGFEDLLDEEGFGSNNAPFSEGLQLALIAIRRDIHGLAVLERERPDIISVGKIHALKYDLLLERGGERSIYFPKKPSFSWNSLMDLWKQSHNIYRSRMKK